MSCCQRLLALVPAIGWVGGIPTLHKGHAKADLTPRTGFGDAFR